MRTDIGKKRKQNEDAAWFDEKRGVFAVADGMGGHLAGEVASAMAIDAVAHMAAQRKKPSIELLKKAVLSAHKKILAHAKGHEECSGRGTTLSVMWRADRYMYIAHVGDSRIYRLRENKLEQITEDHSFVNTLVRIGTITREEARFHPKKNIITRALGAEEEVEADFFPVDLEPEDILVLCTDGLHGEAGDEEILQIIREEEDMQDLCDRLVQLANDKGGSDNITIICLRYKGESHEC